MSENSEVCLVCGEKTVFFARGKDRELMRLLFVSCLLAERKPACNACNLFVRRWKKRLNGIPPCIYDGFCSNVLECRSCRFKKCLELIWNDPSSQKELRAESSSPIHNQSVLFGNMATWNEERETTFLNYKVQYGIEISLQDVLSHRTGNLLIPTQSTTFLEWSFISQLTSIVFLMKLPFYGKLSPDDKKSFVKAHRFKSAMFFLAMHCFQNGKDQLQYPNGIDIFSSAILNCPWILILHDIRTRLICKLKELNVTMEEFYAMSGLFVCNPSNTENLSWDGQHTIKEAQKDFEAILRKQCFISNPVSGPSRCDGLIHVGSTLHDTHEYFERAVLLSEFHSFGEKGQTKKVEFEDQESVLHFE